VGIVIITLLLSAWDAITGQIRTLVKLQALQEQCRWLLKHAYDVTSQCGEDGISSQALDVLPSRNGWCIEFGAWDGRKFSNTHNLVISRGYRGAFIEANRERFHDLQKTYDEKQHVLLNAYVGFGRNDSLDALLEGTSVPFDVDLLSIDIDGNDYYVWEAVHKYQPKLVIIEYNPTASNSVTFVQEKDSRVNQGASAASLVELGRNKGYELIAATYLNLFFVKAEYFGLFHIPDNCLDLMRDDRHCPSIFVGYDGHVLLREGDRNGEITFPWHPTKLTEQHVQAIPKRLQKYPYPDSYSLLERIQWRLLLGRRKP